MREVDYYLLTETIELFFTLSEKYSPSPSVSLPSSLPPSPLCFCFNPQPSQYNFCSLSFDTDMSGSRHFPLVRESNSKNIIKANTCLQCQGYCGKLEGSMPWPESGHNSALYSWCQGRVWVQCGQM